MRDSISTLTQTILFVRVKGYKIIGNNIANCLSACNDEDKVEWYCDRYNLRGTGLHHDGTNYYLYRERKDNINDSQWNNFLNKIYYGKCTKQDISRYTKSLRPRIAKVYGW